MSFKEIRLIRLLVLILLYMIILFVLVFGMVIPIIKQYKLKSKTYHMVQNEYEIVKNDHEAIYDKLKLLQHKNRKIIETFEKKWDEKLFLEKAKMFFVKSKLKLIENNISDPYYTIYEFDATTQMASPENFYRFMEALPSMPFVIQADFPISFYSKDNLISGVFQIRVFHEKIDENISKDKIESKK